LTQAEFAKGWKLLVLQPWGWRYRSLTDQGTMTEETKTQMEFYYAKLKWAHPEAWLKVADLAAQGEDWPSVHSLKLSLQAMNTRFVQGITDARKDAYEPMPDGFMACIGKIGKSMPGTIN